MDPTVLEEVRRLLEQSVRVLSHPDLPCVPFRPELRELAQAAEKLASVMRSAYGVESELQEAICEAKRNSGEPES